MEKELQAQAEKKRQQEQAWKNLCENILPQFMMEHDLDQVTITRTGIAKGKLTRNAQDEIKREVTFISKE